MPAKKFKFTESKVTHTIQVARLANGNLVVPRRMAHDKHLQEWVEVAPGDSLHKRWLPVAVDGLPDPRQSPEHQQRMAEIYATKEFQEWQNKQTPPSKS